MTARMIFANHASDSFFKCNNNINDHLRGYQGGLTRDSVEDALDPVSFYSPVWRVIVAELLFEVEMTGDE
jgi:hypothetical protein